jgi:hypothetical protein
MLERERFAATRYDIKVSTVMGPWRSMDCDGLGDEGADGCGGRGEEVDWAIAVRSSGQRILYGYRNFISDVRGPCLDWHKREACRLLRWM